MTDPRAAFEAWFEADQMGNTEEYYAPMDRAWAAWQAAIKHEREATLESLWAIWRRTTLEQIKCGIECSIEAVQGRSPPPPVDG